MDGRRGEVCDGCGELFDVGEGANFASKGGGGVGAA